MVWDGIGWYGDGQTEGVARKQQQNIQKHPTSREQRTRANEIN